MCPQVHIWITPIEKIIQMWNLENLYCLRFMFLTYQIYHIWQEFIFSLDAYLFLIVYITDCFIIIIRLVQSLSEIWKVLLLHWIYLAFNLHLRFFSTHKILNYVNILYTIWHYWDRTSWQVSICEKNIYQKKYKTKHHIRKKCTYKD